MSKITKPVTDVGKELINGVGSVGKELINGVGTIGKDAVSYTHLEHHLSSQMRIKNNLISM